MPELLQLPPLPSGIKILSNAESDRLDKLYPSIPTKANCITCRGDEKFKGWVDKERTKTGMYACPCIDQAILHWYFLSANIGLAYQRLSWDDAGDAEAGALEATRKYLDDSFEYARHGIGFILHGNIGSGKTMLATLLLKGMLAKGHNGYFTTFTEMRTHLADTWRDVEERRWFYQRIKNAGVLVVDDVGRELKGKTDFSEAVFDDVLRHRVMADKPTIVTGNNDLNDMEAGYGVNVMSLLRESSIIYEFHGPDYRDNAMVRKNKEHADKIVRPIVTE